MFNFWYNRGMEKTKQCKKCGYEQPIDEFYILVGNRIQSWCKSCIKESANTSRKDYKAKWKKLGVCLTCGKEKLPNSRSYCKYHYVYAATQYPAQGRNKKLTLALIEKFDKNPTCPYTGETLILGLNASIDHIKPISKFPELRADLDNLLWTSKRANIAKSTMSKDEFVSFCKLIASRF